MATSRTENMSDEIFNIKCSFCIKENRTREAVKYCVQCTEYFCSPCVDTHNKFASMTKHELLDKANFGSLGQDGSLPSFPTQRCSLHTGKIVDMFCSDHDEVACASCIALNHKTCKNIHSVPEEVVNLYNQTELTYMKQKLQKTKTTLTDMKVAKENRVKELKESLDKEVKSVKAFRQELQELLDKMEQETIKELKQEFARIESFLTNDITEVNHIIDAIDEVSSQLKMSEGNKAQEFVSIKSSKKVTAQAEDVEKEQNRKSEETVSFAADQNIKNSLQQNRALGKVSSKKQSITCHNDSLYTVKLQREINIKLSNDTSTCRIQGSCDTEDGFLLLTDYSNKKLKRLDMSTETVKDYLDLPVQPNAVCLISKTEAAVALSNNSVQIVSLSNKLTGSRSVKMSHYCWGLAHNDDKLFISDTRDTVYIHDMNGQELKKISTDASGKTIFQSTRHITIRTGGDRVFVADCSKGVVILDIQGNYLSTITDPTLSDVWRVCTDGRNLFVCGCNKGNIVQIGQDYKLLGELGKVKYPTSLYFDHHKNRLIVTQGSNNNCTVLELE